MRCLAIYGEMPGRFLLTAILLAAVNIALVAQQVLLGHAVQEAQHGTLVAAGPDGVLDYDRAWFWGTLLIGLALARSAVQYGAGLLSLAIGQDCPRPCANASWSRSSGSISLITGGTVSAEW